MAECKHCGRWAGVGRDAHDDCAKLAAEGKNVEEIKAAVDVVPGAAAPRPLTAGAIFWAIFGALWLYSITAAIVYAVVRAVA